MSISKMLIKWIHSPQIIQFQMERSQLALVSCVAVPAIILVQYAVFRAVVGASRKPPTSDLLKKCSAVKATNEALNAEFAQLDEDHEAGRKAFSRKRGRG